MKSEIHGQFIYVWGCNTVTGEGMTVVRLLVSTPNSISATTTITQDMSFMKGTGYFQTNDNAGGIMVNPINPTQITMLRVPHGTLSNYVSMGLFEKTPFSPTVYNYSPNPITVGGTTVKAGATGSFARNSDATLTVNNITFKETDANNGGVGMVLTKSDPPIYVLFNNVSQLFVLGAAALWTDQDAKTGFIPPSQYYKTALIGYMAPSSITWNGGGFSIMGRALPKDIPIDEPYPSTVATATYTYLCWNPENYRGMGAINPIHAIDICTPCVIINSRGQTPSIFEGRAGMTIMSGYSENSNYQTRTVFPIGLCKSMSEKPEYPNAFYNETPSPPCTSFTTFEGVTIPYTQIEKLCVPAAPIKDSMGNILPCTIDGASGVVYCDSPDGSKKCMLENGDMDFSCSVTGYPSVRKDCKEYGPYKTIGGFSIPYGTDGADCYPANPGGGVIPVVGPDGKVISPKCTKPSDDTSITCGNLKIDVGESAFTIQPN